MLYVRSRYQIFDREQAYRIYVTDAIRLVAKLNIRYADMFKQNTSSNRTGDEIINDITAKLKAMEVNDGSTDTGSEIDP